jgi:tRNA A-37 threonylcarbamoyl transferase component Bud32
MFSFSKITETITYHSEQILKGLAVVGLGAVAYLGLSSLFGNKSNSKENDSKIEELDTNDLVSLTKKDQVTFDIPSNIAMTYISTEQPSTELQTTPSTNKPPVLVNNTLTLTYDEEIISITSSNLAATDEDDDPGSLVFTVSGMSEYSYFAILANDNNTLLPTDQFTQEQVIMDKIKFYANYNQYNLIRAPLYEISVSDAYNITQPSWANVTVNYLQSVPAEPVRYLQNFMYIRLKLSDDIFFATNLAYYGQMPPYYGQLYFADGKSNPGFSIGDNCNTTYYYYDHSEAAVRDKFALIYACGDTQPTRVYGQIYNNNGTKLYPKIELNYHNDDNLYTRKDVFGIANDNFVFSTANINNVRYVQIYSNTSPVGNEFQYDHTENLVVVDFTHDKFMLIRRDTTNNRPLIGQFFNYNGAKLGNELILDSTDIIKLTDDKFISSTGQVYYYNGTKESKVNFFQPRSYPNTSGIIMQKSFRDDRKFAVYCSRVQFILCHEYDNQKTTLERRFIIKGGINNFDVSFYGYKVANFPDHKFAITSSSSGNFWQIFSSNITSGEFPKLINNTLTINIGESRILSSNELSATVAGQLIDSLRFISNNAKHCKFEYANNGEIVTDFTQKEVMTRLVQITHDNTKYPPSYSMSVVEDNFGFGTIAMPATVNFNQDIPTSKSAITPSLSSTTIPSIDNTATIVGAVLGAAGGVALLTTFGILYKRYKNRQNHNSGILSYPLLAAANMDNLSAGHDLQDIPKSAVTFDDELGQGSFATVYKGRWQGSTVAIKKLNDIMLVLNSKNALAEFKREAGIMNALKHPNIVQLFGICEEGKTAYIVMEFMPGGSLFAFLRKPASEPWQVRFPIIIDITNGLVYMHSQSMLHRDLKSLNILLTADNHAKISDFGLSKVVESQTINKTNVGSPAWAAPEVLRSQPYTDRADVYSYGVILWEIGTRQELYPNCDHFQVINKVKAGERPPLPAEKDCSKPYVSLLQDCWAQRAENRPSMQAVQNLLPNIEQALVPSH